MFYRMLGPAAAQGREQAGRSETCANEFYMSPVSPPTAAVQASCRTNVRAQAVKLEAVVGRSPLAGDRITTCDPVESTLGDLLEWWREHPNE